MPGNLRKLEKFLINISDNYRQLVVALLIIMIPSIYLLVYYTGGAKYVYTHTMYIPIVLAGLSLGNPWGAVTGLVAGILLGPMMPLDTATNESQMIINWTFRMIIFAIIGLLSGYFTSIIRTFFNRLTLLISFNPETKIPNTNYIANHPLPCKPNQIYLIVTILVHNYEKIVNLVGTDVYYRFLSKFHSFVYPKIPNICYFVQAESNKLWLVIEQNHLQEDMENLLNIFSQPLDSEEVPFYVDYSLGCTSVTGSDQLYQLTTFSQSDEAALQSQVLGTRYEVYNIEYMQKFSDYNLLGEFHKALKENQTHLVYQPKIDLLTNKPYCFEALIRWEHPKYGLIMPGRFIPLVEQTNLIHDLTDWVITQAINKILEFKAQGIIINIAINVSSKNLANPNFYKSVMSKIREAGIDPSQIELEITESHIMVNPKENTKILNMFVRAGLTVALDDFGTGYSALSLLGRLPAKIIKIDRSFMKNIDTDHTTYHIVNAIIDIAHKLRCKVVAEGVETEEVHHIVKKLKVDLGQGFYYAKPIHRDKVIEWYQKQIQD